MSRAQKILEILRKTYAREKNDFVRWNTPLELVIGTVLSAQCTDKKVNEVTRTLFRHYRTAEDYANADILSLEKLIHATGFYKSKAKYLKGIGSVLVEKFHGHVPRTLAQLLTLPGVSYKSAYLVLAKAYGENVGIAVDTHVQRLAPRLGLTTNTDPKKISADLSRLFTSNDYLDVNEFFILHGRAICKSSPQCDRCPLRALCPTGKKITRCS